MAECVIKSNTLKTFPALHHLFCSTADRYLIPTSTKPYYICHFDIISILAFQYWRYGDRGRIDIELMRENLYVISKCYEKTSIQQLVLSYIMSCVRSGLWPFWLVAISVYGLFGLWPFRSVAVMSCYLPPDQAENTGFSERNQIPCQRDFVQKWPHHVPCRRRLF